MTVQTEGRASPDIVAKAAEWAVELDGDAPAEVVAACEAWCAEHPLHRRTLDRMRGIEARLEGLDQQARTALRRTTGTPARRKRTIGAGAVAAVAGVALLTGWFGLQSRAFQGLSPQYQTARGEQRTLALADGSTLVLDTASAASADLDADARRVELFRGQVFAQVAPDRKAPFTVRTSAGEVTALGTAFIVRDEGNETYVTVVESRVRACRKTLMTEPTCVDLGAGERARLSRSGVARLTAVDVREASAWTTGWLEADDRPVSEVLDILNRYRDRPVAFDRQALSGLRVTGSYPLKDTDRALEAISGATGLRVTRDGGETAIRPAD